MFHTTAAQSNCSMGSMQAAGWCWQTLESIQGCNPNCLTTETLLQGSRHTICFTWWWRMPFRPCPVAPGTHLYHLFAGDNTCLYHAELFLETCFGKMTQLYPDLYPHPDLLLLFPCDARHLEKGVISVTEPERPGDFVLVDHQVLSPWKTVPFFVCPLYTMAATPLVLKKGHVLDIWTKRQTRKRQLKSEG